ncbi:hypothetical protein Lser_V15G40569 [Lactuca serriola]
MIDNHGGLVREHMPGRYAELDQYWGESQVMGPGPRADSWADEFSQQHGGDPNAWALSFEQQHGTGGWAFKFQHEQTQMMSVDRMAGANIPSLAAMEQTCMLAHTLAQDTNPKFQGHYEVGGSPARPQHVYELCFSHGQDTLFDACDFTKTKAVEGISRKEVDPLERLTDQDIRTAIHNATGPRSALFVPEGSTSSFGSKTNSSVVGSCLQCARLVCNELVKVFNLPKQ